MLPTPSGSVGAQVEDDIVQRKVTRLLASGGKFVMTIELCFSCLQGS